MNYIDLTRTVSPTIPVYPGDHPPEFKKLNDLEKNGFEMYEVTSGMHVGTHMDAPRHFIKNGNLIDKIKLDRFFGQGVLITDLNKPLTNEVDHAILMIQSGHEKLWGTDSYFTDYHAIPLAFAQDCIDHQVKMICVDMPSVDYDKHEVHTLLLQHDILIVENVCNLDALKDVESFEVIALPAKYETEAAPCRIVARIV